MKVLQLIKTAAGAKWALLQVRELLKLGVEVSVAMPSNGPRFSEFKDLGAKVFEIEYSLKSLGQTSKRLRGIVEEVKPDIIHSHFVLTTIIMRMALRSYKIPRVFQVPGPLHLEHFIFRKIEIGLSQNSDYWVSSCNWTTDCYLRNGINRERLFLSYYGNEFTNKEDFEITSLHDELNIPSDAILVGMVAYMYAPKKYLGQKRGLKGHEDFIDAIRIASEKNSHIYGICVGGAWNGAVEYEECIKEYAKKRTDHVIFLGNRKDIVSLYSNFYCVAHPSLSENLGGAAESLILGVPTISTNVGGFPDIVKDHETGLLVSPKSPKELADAILYMVDHPLEAKKMADAGSVLVHELLDVRNTAKTLLNAYNCILNRK